MVLLGPVRTRRLESKDSDEHGRDVPDSTTLNAALQLNPSTRRANQTLRGMTSGSKSHAVGQMSISTGMPMSARAGTGMVSPIIRHIVVAMAAHASLI